MLTSAVIDGADGADRAITGLIAQVEVIIVNRQFIAAIAACFGGHLTRLLVHNYSGDSGENRRIVTLRVCAVRERAKIVRKFTGV